LDFVKSSDFVLCASLCYFGCVSIVRRCLKNEKGQKLKAELRSEQPKPELGSEQPSMQLRRRNCQGFQVLVEVSHFSRRGNDSVFRNA